MPSELLTDDNVIKLMTLLFPCSIRQPIQGINLCLERTLFVNVFRESIPEMRNEFFRQPLVKYLWQDIFIKEYGNEITSYFRLVRSNKDRGELKFIRMMQEFHALEKALNVKMLPEQARD